MKYFLLNEILLCVKKIFIILGVFKMCNIYIFGFVIMFELWDFLYVYIVFYENFKGVNKEKGLNVEINL